MKPRTIAGLAAVVIIILLASSTISTRAYYFKYVQPQMVKFTPEIEKKEEKVDVYMPVKKVKGYATGYFGPIKEEYTSKEKYLKAIKMNGEGKFTKSGTKPKIGTLAADTRYYPFGTVIYIPETDLWGVVEDVGSMVKGERHIDIFCGHGKQAERIANQWGPGTPITLIVMKRVNQA